jgi:hypothetical protein
MLFTSLLFDSQDVIDRKFAFHKKNLGDSIFGKLPDKSYIREYKEYL